MEWLIILLVGIVVCLAVSWTINVIDKKKLRKELGILRGEVDRNIDTLMRLQEKYEVKQKVHHFEDLAHDAHMLDDNSVGGLRNVISIYLLINSDIKSILNNLKVHLQETMPSDDEVSGEAG